MTFESGTDALHAVQDYALAHGKAVKVKQRSGMHRLIGFYRKRRADKTYGPWYISSMNTEHVNCVSSANPTRRQIAELPTFESAVRADYTISAPALAEQVQHRDGISLQKKRRTLYRAREAVHELSSKDLARSYEKIPSYLAQFAALNPGSVAVAERDQQGHFKRAIIVVKVFADAVAARQTVLGNYTWFFSMLKQNGYDFTGVPMFCDRSRALISVALEMGLNLKYCTLHIIRNLLARFRKFTHGHKKLIWALQSAETEDLYSSRLAWIGLELGPDVETYLSDIPTKKLVLTPSAEKLHCKESSKIGQYAVQQASPEVYYDRTCTCARMDQMGMPCRHLIAVLESSEIFSIVKTEYSTSPLANRSLS
ncbi:hypothetical protein PHYSODRAFT_492008 [Phytophthora sojae]|uniref:SWIM-type domain-containing protein n=1 Tax=Phytophthora sojae (strain P6497) TaxID=1094619 RepID=G4Z9G3_PHYSP|nr:hypothetical protein PHYSODRAFT_492008 [Phytophthora sojae]EGZ22595.1 hypothetical protein PHYSODRAFT_492008 [Phytophthora sojae]|eukprot:XP_009525312.1 hypothetical protein PHYSODRAFT_492008 [Phytophthora sojae]